MKNYQKAFMDYLSAHPTSLAESEMEDLLDVLFHCYQECRKTDSEEIREQFQSLDTVLSQLSLDDNNRVFMITCQLCDQHSREAFQTGILTGFHLLQALKA